MTIVDRSGPGVRITLLERRDPPRASAHSRALGSTAPGASPKQPDPGSNERASRQTPRGFRVSGDSRLAPIAARSSFAASA
jgi:hypothetical protein